MGDVATFNGGCPPHCTPFAVTRALNCLRTHLTTSLQDTYFGCRVTVGQRANLDLNTFVRVG